MSDTNGKNRCKGTSGHIGMNTNPPRPCSLYAKPGTDYCIYHTYGYETARSKKSSERYRKESEERRAALAEKEKHDKLHRILIIAIKDIAAGHNNARGIALALVRNWNL